MSSSHNNNDNIVCSSEVTASEKTANDNGGGKTSSFNPPVTKEMRQRMLNYFKRPINIPIFVQKEKEQKDELSYGERKRAQLRKTRRVYYSPSAPSILVGHYEYYYRNLPQPQIFDSWHIMRECEEDEPSMTKSCPGFYVYPPEKFKWIAEMEAKYPDLFCCPRNFLTRKPKLETVKEIDDEKDSVTIETRSCSLSTSCCSKRLLTEFDDYFDLSVVTVYSEIAIQKSTATGINDVVNCTLDSSSNSWSSSDYNIEPDYNIDSISSALSLPSQEDSLHEAIELSYEEINTLKNCLPSFESSRIYFMDHPWLWNSLSFSSMESLDTMKELDPEKWQLLKLDTERQLASLEFFTANSTDYGTYTPDSSKLSYTNSCWSTSSEDNFFNNNLSIEFPSKMTSTNSESEVYSPPSSILSSQSMFGSIEARQDVRNLALSSGNMDNFLELIPERLLNYFTE